jgi:hypothetical protein
MRAPRGAKDRTGDLYRPPAAPVSAQEAEGKHYADRALSFLETVGVLLGTIIVVVSLAYVAIAILR